LRFVDSNVFIYVLVKSPKDDYVIAKRILQRIEEGEEAVTNMAVIQEIVNWLEYNNNRRREIEKLLTAINSYIAMKKAGVSWSDMIAAIDDMNKYGLDFVDALTLQTMKRNNINEIYTNDRDFDRVKWVRRVWK